MKLNTVRWNNKDELLSAAMRRVKLEAGNKELPLPLRGLCVNMIFFSASVLGRKVEVIMILVDAGWNETGKCLFPPTPPPAHDLSPFLSRPPTFSLFKFVQKAFIVYLLSL